MEVTDVLENYNNLEKECEGAKQPVSVELQVGTTFLERVPLRAVVSRRDLPV